MICDSLPVINLIVLDALRMLVYGWLMLKQFGREQFYWKTIKVNRSFMYCVMMARFV
jgi:hypothetical protein